MCVRSCSFRSQSYRFNFCTIRSMMLYGICVSLRIDQIMFMFILASAIAVRPHTSNYYIFEPIVIQNESDAEKTTIRWSLSLMSEL